jgi:regulator of protease activity HflC (stomatin/prohibitin superfamily)
VKKPNLVRFALFALVAALAGGCTRQVPPASVGIKFNASSGISEQLVKPQVVWVGPRDQLIVYPTSIRNATYTRTATEGERTGDDSVSASTMEGSVLPVDVTVAFHVEPHDVLKAFANFGTEDLLDIQQNYVRWSTIYAVNVVSGNHSIFDLTSKDRASFGREVRDVLGPMMANWGITVDDVYVGEVYPNDEVKEKVDERIAMRNSLELAKVNLQRARIDAQTTLTNARKEAELNKLLAMQGEKTLQLKRLELQRLVIEKWNGRAPILGGANIPFTDIALK